MTSTGQSAPDIRKKLQHLYRALGINPSQLVDVAFKAELSNVRPVGGMRPRLAINVAQHKIVNLLKTL